MWQPSQFEEAQIIHRSCEGEISNGCSKKQSRRKEFIREVASHEETVRKAGDSISKPLGGIRKLLQLRWRQSFRIMRHRI
jgi:hypothetical protein